jgi:uncharacterized membrane protein
MASPKPGHPEKSQAVQNPTTKKKEGEFNQQRLNLTLLVFGSIPFFSVSFFSATFLYIRPSSPRVPFSSKRRPFQ